MLFLNEKRVLGYEIYINIEMSKSFISYFILKSNTNIDNKYFKISFDFILTVILSGILNGFFMYYLNLIFYDK